MSRRRISFRVSILIDDSRVKDVRMCLQSFLREGLATYIRTSIDWTRVENRAERRLHILASGIAQDPDSIQVTHLRERMTWKRRLFRWLGGKLL